VILRPVTPRAPVSEFRHRRDVALPWAFAVRSLLAAGARELVKAVVGADFSCYLCERGPALCVALPRRHRWSSSWGFFAQAMHVPVAPVLLESIWRKLCPPAAAPPPLVGPRCSQHLLPPSASLCAPSWLLWFVAVAFRAEVPVLISPRRACCCPVERNGAVSPRGPSASFAAAVRNSCRPAIPNRAPVSVSPREAAAGVTLHEAFRVLWSPVRGSLGPESCADSRPRKKRVPLI